MRGLKLKRPIPENNKLWSFCRELPEFIWEKTDKVAALGRVADELCRQSYIYIVPQNVIPNIITDKGDML